MGAATNRWTSAAFALTILLVSLSGAYARQLRGGNDEQLDQVFAQGREYLGELPANAAQMSRIALDVC
jgi:hypothetical protein